MYIYTSLFSQPFLNHLPLPAFPVIQAFPNGATLGGVLLYLGVAGLLIAEAYYWSSVHIFKDGALLLVRWARTVRRLDCSESLLII